MAIKNAIRWDVPTRPSAGAPEPSPTDEVFRLSLPSGARATLRRFDAELNIIGPVPVAYTFDTEMVIAPGDVRRFDAQMEIISSTYRLTFQTELEIIGTDARRFDARLETYSGGTPRTRRFDAALLITNTSDIRRFDAELSIFKTKSWRFDARMSLVIFNPLAGIRRVGGETEHL